MGIKRIVDIGFWTDGKVSEFTMEEKYFLLFLLTNPFSKQLGIYEINLKQAAFQMGCSPAKFTTLLVRFEEKYGIIVVSFTDRYSCEVAILNYMRYSIVKGGKPVEDCIKKDMSLVKDRKLIDIVFAHLTQIMRRSPDSINDTVKQIITDYMNANNNDTASRNKDANDKPNVSDDDIGNDNERFADDSSSHPLLGRYANVRLSDTEIELLKASYPHKYEQYIDRLSTYMAQHNKTYDNHYVTIDSWILSDAENPASFDEDDFFAKSVGKTKSKQAERKRLAETKQVKH